MKFDRGECLPASQVTRNDRTLSSALPFALSSHLIQARAPLRFRVMEISVNCK